MQMMMNSQHSDRRRAKRSRLLSNMEKFEKQAPKLGGKKGEREMELWLAKIEEEANRLQLLSEEDFVVNLKLLMVDETVEGGRGGKTVNYLEKHENILNKKSYRKLRREISEAKTAYSEY